VFDEKAGCVAAQFSSAAFELPADPQAGFNTTMRLNGNLSLGARRYENERQPVVKGRTHNRQLRGCKQMRTRGRSDEDNASVFFLSFYL
jgi:hypothetical protein